MKCRVEKCAKAGNPQFWGMCMTHYSEAKKLVAAGKTTRDELERLGLATADAPAGSLLEDLENRRQNAAAD